MLNTTFIRDFPSPAINLTFFFIHSFMDFQFILLTTDNARLIDLHTFIGNFLYGVITSIYLFFFSLFLSTQFFHSRWFFLSSTSRHCFAPDNELVFIDINFSLCPYFHSYFHSRSHLPSFSHTHIHTLSLCIVRFDFLWKNNSLNLLRQLKTHTHLL